jgi:hypothetical protein
VTTASGSGISSVDVCRLCYMRSLLYGDDTEVAEVHCGVWQVGMLCRRGSSCLCRCCCCGRRIRGTPRAPRLCQGDRFHIDELSYMEYARACNHQVVIHRLALAECMCSVVRHHWCHSCPCHWQPGDVSAAVSMPLNMSELDHDVWTQKVAVFKSGGAVSMSSQTHVTAELQTRCQFVAHHKAVHPSCHHLG